MTNGYKVNNHDEIPTSIIMMKIVNKHEENKSINMKKYLRQ